MTKKQLIAADLLNFLRDYQLACLLGNWKDRQINLLHETLEAVKLYLP